MFATLAHARAPVAPQPPPTAARAALIVVNGYHFESGRPTECNGAKHLSNPPDEKSCRIGEAFPLSGTMFVRHRGHRSGCARCRAPLASRQTGGEPRADTGISLHCTLIASAGLRASPNDSA